MKGVLTICSCTERGFIFILSEESSQMKHTAIKYYLKLLGDKYNYERANYLHTQVIVYCI